MSLYPILWAVEHAPVKDATERAILSALVMKGSFDGRDCHRSYRTLAQVARCDRKTAERKCHAMEARGLLHRQTGQMPTSWRRLPADKKTVVWEVMIPADFWSAVQLEEINTARTERGLPPITPQNRPPLGAPPSAAPRADKGRKKSRPDSEVNEATLSRSRKRGDSQSPRSNRGGGTLSPVAGGLRVPSRGDSQSPKPPNNPPIKTSSSSSPVVTPAPDRAAGREVQEEEEEATASAEKDDHGQDRESGPLAEALRVVDVAAARWDGHRLPTASERLRLAERVADALTQGARRVGVLDALTRDLEPSRTRSAVAVVMSRTAQPGWAELPGVGQAAAERPTLPPQCGRCVNRMIELPDGRVRRCPACHPNAKPAVEGVGADEPERVVLDVIDLEASEGAAEVVPLAR